MLIVEGICAGLPCLCYTQRHAAGEHSRGGELGPIEVFFVFGVVCALEIIGRERFSVDSKMM